MSANMGHRTFCMRLVQFQDQDRLITIVTQHVRLRSEGFLRGLR